MIKLSSRTNKKKILIAPLNWGLGHATRCIPIINALILENFEPILAGDGDSLLLLQKEFPKLKNYLLPSYNIRYTKKGHHLKYKILFAVPGIIKVIKKEQKLVAKIIEKENINGIISDNRFGVRSDKIPSVYITHQINVLSGITTAISSKFHQNIISKFDECWIPDYRGKDNLAGELSHSNKTKLNLKHIGPLSRFKNKNLSKNETPATKKNDVMVILSGPEPQRSILEKKLLKEFKNYNKKLLFVRGILSDSSNTKKVITENKNTSIVNYLLQDDLQKAIIESKIILARSGYSTIMDLNQLKSKAFFIPTPGQFEQEYLAVHLKDKNIAPFSSQDKFDIQMLKKVDDYRGFQIENQELHQLSFEVFSKKYKAL